MRKIKHLLINIILHYSTLIMPCLNYCYKILGNTYKSRIQPLHIIQKRAIRIAKRLSIGLILDHSSTN